MLRGEKQIRLTRREVDRLARITGFEPVDVRPVEDLRAYAADCKRHYWGVSEDTRFLHWLIDRELGYCLSEELCRRT